MVFLKNTANVLALDRRAAFDIPAKFKPLSLALWSNGLLFKTLDFQSRGPVLKTTEWLQGRLSLSSFRGRQNECQLLIYCNTFAKL